MVWRVAVLGCNSVTAPATLTRSENAPSTTNGYDSWLGKLDYVASAKSRFWFRYGQTPWVNFAGLVWGPNPAEPSNQYPQTRVPRDWAADWTYLLTPFAFFDLRTGLARYEAFSGNGFGVNYDPRLLGFPNSLVSKFTALLFPRFNIGSYSPIGAQGVSSYLTQDAWSVSPSLSLVKNRHYLTLGAELRRYNDNNLNPGLASGSYTFSPAGTQANPSAPIARPATRSRLFCWAIPPAASWIAISTQRIRQVTTRSMHRTISR